MTTSLEMLDTSSYLTQKLPRLRRGQTLGSPTPAVSVFLRVSYQGRSLFYSRFRELSLLDTSFRLHQNATRSDSERN